MIRVMSTVNVSYPFFKCWWMKLAPLLIVCCFCLVTKWVTWNSLEEEGRINELFSKHWITNLSGDVSIWTTSSHGRSVHTEQKHKQHVKCWSHVSRAEIKDPRHFPCAWEFHLYLTRWPSWERILICNCDLAKIKRSNSTHTTTQSYTWSKTNIQSIIQ